jgi:hypothetical protein
MYDDDYKRMYAKGLEKGRKLERTKCIFLGLVYAAIFGVVWAGVTHMLGC